MKHDHPAKKFLWTLHVSYLLDRNDPHELPKVYTQGAFCTFKDAEAIAGVIEQAHLRCGGKVVHTEFVRES